MYGWFSAQAYKQIGSIKWRREDGSQVEVTHVSRTLDHGCFWSDIRCVAEGDLVEYVNGSESLTAMIRNREFDRLAEDAERYSWDDAQPDYEE